MGPMPPRPMPPTERAAPGPPPGPPAMGPEMMPRERMEGGCPLYSNGNCTFLERPVEELVQMQEGTAEQAEPMPEEPAE